MSRLSEFKFPLSLPEYGYVKRIGIVISRRDWIEAYNDYYMSYCRNEYHDQHTCSLK